MRAEPIAIRVAMDKYKNDKWIGIFTDSQTNIHAIQSQLRRPSYTPYHYHHKPLISAIVNALHYRGSLGLPTQLTKIRGIQTSEAMT
jgi:hypothetical protein